MISQSAFSSTASQTAAPLLADVLADRTLLDLDRARAELAALGLAVSHFQMSRWASSRTLPFFKLGKKLFIQRGELHKALQAMQLAALRGEGKRQDGRRRRFN